MLRYITNFVTFCTKIKIKNDVNLLYTKLIWSAKSDKGKAHNNQVRNQNHEGIDRARRVGVEHFLHRCSPSPVRHRARGSTIPTVQNPFSTLFTSTLSWKQSSHEIHAKDSYNIIIFSHFSMTTLNHSTTNNPPTLVFFF